MLDDNDHGLQMEHKHRQKKKRSKNVKAQNQTTSTYVQNFITPDQYIDDNVESSQYIVNWNDKYFKLVDVPGDGDCYFHSILKNTLLSEHFSSSDDIRLYLTKLFSLHMNMIHI